MNVCKYMDVCVNVCMYMYVCVNVCMYMDVCMCECVTGAFVILFTCIIIFFKQNRLRRKKSGILGILNIKQVVYYKVVRVYFSAHYGNE